MDELQKLKNIYLELQEKMRKQFNRSLSFGDYFTDRWERAKREGFGEGTSVYDNVLILGDVKVGKNVWVGPNCILDGRGGLTIGDHCAISAGAHLYSHHTVKQAITMGEADIEVAPTKIGNGVYIGPNSVVQMGVTIGDRAIIGALSFVNRDVPADCTAYGSPVQISKREPSR
ncbi:MAG: acyltransferase [Pseudomonadota bacterium]